MIGLFFCLASDTVQGFLFARMQHSPTQAFTARFVQSMQLYRPRRKTARKALQGLFLRLHPFNRPRCQTDTSGYNTTCATLERIHAPGRPQPIPDTTATPGRCAGQHRPPIIIRYIRGQTMPAAAGQRQHLSIWQGSARRGLDTSHVWHRVSSQGAPSTRRGSPAAGARRAGGTIGGFRRSSFSGFRPIANRGQQ